MKNLLKFYSDHGTAASLLSALVLFLIATALIFRPELVLIILRYGAAALNIFGGLWIIITLLRRKVKR